MQSSGLTYDDIGRRYVVAVDELYEIARTYFMLGRSSKAQHVLRTSLQLLETEETGETGKEQFRLKLLLLYGQVLIVDHLLTRGEADPLLSTLLEAKQIAEATGNQQGIADALGLLGHAHYFTTIVAKLKKGESPNSPQEQGEYDEAMTYQQQALKLREALHDTRGISESYFQIGVLHERWQQNEKAMEYYTKARQIADSYGHAFEKTEPTRHFTLHALMRGDLDQAVTLGLQAVKLREEAHFKLYLPLDHLLLSTIYQAKGDTAKAQSHIEIASALAEEMGMPALVASMPNIRSVMESQQKEA